MEDEKLAAYYDDLTRRGGAAARFKQGLGFSSSNANSDVPSRGSALPSTSSFLSGFVRASSPSKTSEFEKQAQLQSIQDKLSKKHKEKTRSRSPSRNSSRRSRSRSRDRIRDKHSRRRSRSRSRSRDRHSRRRSRSRSRDRRSRRRSRSREDESRRKYRSRSRSREKNRERSRRHGCGGGVDYAKLIEGYDSMTPAERVKAKMKLQLSKTVENDETIGKGSGWERFDFNKDAPLDDEEEIEAAEDDAVLVKHMGQSFRFSAVEARKEEEIKAAHDEAMFGGSSYPPPAETDDEAEKESQTKQKIESAPVTSLLSTQVLTMQQGSWRDRARKP
ncbi:LOW QUALITY PROTEIN: probable ATP-dependent RNA helicase DDX46 [Sesamum indicum]|uniref:LOW QUALITY PROTEIN: probable ATP-dependent RNA helicase DDX46 n=1 Tax=Sesamum indicum TaxID=4182 RepID=A0A6I9SW61_SESIN|nr:LOW QUALITY PROTEIN: probable ATP-dependent RNA helicase DDX46 [Sesamum indicum]